MASLCMLPLGIERWHFPNGIIRAKESTSIIALAVAVTTQYC